MERRSCLQPGLYGLECLVIRCRVCREFMNHLFLCSPFVPAGLLGVPDALWGVQVGVGVHPSRTPGAGGRLQWTALNMSWWAVEGLERAAHCVASGSFGGEGSVG